MSLSKQQNTTNLQHKTLNSEWNQPISIDFLVHVVVQEGVQYLDLVVFPDLVFVCSDRAVFDGWAACYDWVELAEEHVTDPWGNPLGGSMSTLYWVRLLDILSRKLKMTIKFHLHVNILIRDSVTQVYP